MEPAGETEEMETPTHLEAPRMSELEERGLMWCGAKATVRNRVRWRALVEDLCSIRNEEER